MLHANIRHAGNFAFLGKSHSNHWAIMDGSEKIGAEDGAPRPKELLLFALGGCTAFDVVTVLKKRRVPYDGFEIEVHAAEATDHPMVFTGVELEYRFEGADLAVSELERAVRLSEEKYCAVSAMLRTACPIDWRIVLNGREVLRNSRSVQGAA